MSNRVSEAAMANHVDRRCYSYKYISATLIIMGHGCCFHNCQVCISAEA